MWKCKLLSKWVTTGNVTNIDAAKFLRSGDSIMDVTGQPTPVNSLAVFELWCNDPTTIDDIANDAIYGNALLYMECDEEGEPATSPGKVISELAKASAEQVFALKQVMQDFDAPPNIIGKVMSNRRFGDIAKTLAAEFKAMRTTAKTK